ncbi:uncharacterized protein METZ01_LOCUS279036, partial [marine metagenome]
AGTWSTLLEAFGGAGGVTARPARVTVPSPAGRSSRASEGARPGSCCLR